MHYNPISIIRLEACFALLASFFFNLLVSLPRHLNASPNRWTKIARASVFFSILDVSVLENYIKLYQTT